MATIKDVAKRAGVAISTASAALNRSAPVSDEVIAPSFRPKDEPSSASLVTVVVSGGDETVRCPMLPTP